MSTKTTLKHARLRATLRHGDPASEDPPSAAAFRQMRREILNAVSTSPNRRSRRYGWRAFALASAFVLVVLSLGFGHLAKAPRAIRDAERPPSVAGQSLPASGSRQVYFQTSSGTRIVWRLTGESPSPVGKTDP